MIQQGLDGISVSLGLSRARGRESDQNLGMSTNVCEQELEAALIESSTPCDIRVFRKGIEQKPGTEGDIRRARISKISGLLPIGDPRSKAPSILKHSIKETSLQAIWVYLVGID